MKAILNEDDHKRNTRWSKQVASSLVKISAADNWLFSLYSLSRLEMRRGGKENNKNRWSTTQNWTQLFID